MKPPRPYRRALQKSSRAFTRWVRVDEGLRLACCDCGLVHQLRFAVNDQGHILMAIRRHIEATKQQREAVRARGEEKESD